ncbi:hypothetical protein RND81_05G177300 [Saponaria officinalis]|uniref:Retrotransposon gag domain-containing protein n=1 Tax=Saponaria officinalis TaxID=3572 RepID=A0AAW1L218_SAPOF
MHNTRNSKQPVQYDPEIERTARRLRKETREKQLEEKLYLELLFVEEEMARERTLRELSAPTLGAQPLSIVFPDLERPLKLNSGFINLLPKFSGRANENPQRHLQEFIVVCSSMQLDGVDQDQIKMRAFPFSLLDAAKDWLYYLPAGSITSWALLESAFLEKFLPASRIGAIRKKICGIKQRPDESLYEYRERFNRLCASCPQHQISDELLIQYFYDGLSLKDKSIIDAASGGVLMNKTARAARELIDNMALNSQQYSSRDDVRGVSGVDLSAIRSELQENSQQIANLTTLMSKLVSNNSPANLCHVMNDGVHSEDVNAMNGFPKSYPRKYDPYSSTYNEGWRDNPNLRYGPPKPTQPYVASKPFVLNNAAQNSQNSSSLEDMLKQLTTQIGQVHSQGTQYQQKTDAHLRQLDTQISQMCTSLSNIESRLSGSLPSQPLPNPTENAKAISLRSG